MLEPGCRLPAADAGTDCYKAPEQFSGGRRDGRKGDVWSLGIVLLELATQKFAWEGPGLGAQVRCPSISL